MAILLNDNVQIFAPKALDNRYGPYTTLELAKSSVAIVNRHLGLTVGIGTTLVVEYWWKAGIADTDLVVKTVDDGGTSGPLLSVTDAGGDGSVTYDSVTGVLTYTGPSATEVRAHLSATDAGGDGSFAFDPLTGAFTYTGPSASEVRAHLSAIDAGGDGSFAYDSLTGAFTYTGPSATEVRSHFTAGTGVAITNGQISIGQSVATTSNVQFADLTLTDLLTVQGQARVSDGTVTTPSFSFTSEPSTGLYRSAPGNVSVGIGGVKKATVSASGLDVFGELNLPGTEFTTTLQLVPPTENRLISFPNRSGTVLVTDEAGQFRLDDLSDVDLSAGLYEKATICWSGTTQTWVVGPDYWEDVGSSNLQSLYRVVLGELDNSDGGSVGPKLKVHGDTATTGDLRLGTSLYLGYRPVDDGPDIPARAGAVLQRVFEYELDYFNGSVSTDSNVTILTLDPTDPGLVTPRSVEFTIQIESSDGTYQVVKLSGIRATNTEWNQTVYGLISNFIDPVTSDVGKLYNFSLQTELSGSAYVTVLKAYATGNVSEFESYKITGFYIAIGTNPPQTPPPTNYNFNSTWLNNSSLQSIYITGNPA